MPLRPHFRSGRRGPGPCLRAARTVALGVILGSLGGALTVAGLALVERRPTAGLDPSLPVSVANSARRALPTPEGGPKWRLVSRVETPWGVAFRLRPFASQTEVRGVDCVVWSPLNSADSVSTRLLEADPAKVDWAGLRRTAQALEAGYGASSLRQSLPQGLSADRWGAPPKFFLELQDGSDPPWVGAAELALQPEQLEGASLLRNLPWSGPVPDLRGPLDLRLTFDPNTLELTRAQDLRLYDDAAGSRTVAPHPSPAGAAPVGMALLFDPNPVVTSGRRDLRDGMDVEPYRFWRALPRLDGSGYLRGRWIDTGNDRTPRAREEGLLYSYLSQDPRFDEAMAYFHGDRALERVDSLGYYGLFAGPLSVRVHATAMDNSWYSRPLRAVFLGDGGVDDAQDADIILHEIGHAIHDAFVPGFGGGDTQAISEGFGDFWAGSLTGDPCIGDWDATVYSPPCLRRTDTNALYPYSRVGRPHEDGQIWSGLLWDLRGRLGPRETERLALAGFLEQGATTTYPEAARGLLRAADRIGLGDRAAEVRSALEIRGLLPRRVEVTLTPEESFRIDLIGPARYLDRTVQALVLSGDGRLVFSEARAGTEAGGFPAGPPCAVPCGLAPTTSGGPLPGGSGTPTGQGGTVPPNLRLRVVAEIESGTARIHQEWLAGAITLVRCEATWNGAEGDLRWTYLEAQPEADPLPIYGGASRGDLPPDSLRVIRLEDLPLSGVAGLQGFWGTLTAGPGTGGVETLLGARFHISADPGQSGFRLVRETSPLRVGDLQILLTAQPNPFRQELQLQIYLKRTEPVHVEILDVQGRHLRALLNGRLESGIHGLPWDGRDDAGRRAPSGLYWVLARGTDATARLRVLRLQ